jgi:hypothetical protein
MGDLVLKTAAAETIMGDVATTYSRAQARGGKWAELAEKMLGNQLKLAATLADQRRAADAELRPMLAALDAQDDHADKLIGQISDEVWNAIDRPAFDPTYDVVFPNGISYYTGGPDAEQPDRMDLLAQLIEMNMIKRLTPDQCKSFAQRVRDESAAYRKVLSQVAAPRARVQMFDRATTALAQSSQMALSHLKRLYRAEGFTEAEIHTVIPDRPRKKASSTTPPSPAPTPSAA